MNLSASCRGRFLPAAAAAGLVVLAACAPRPAASRRVAVDIQGMAFAPESIAANAGDTIVWHNRDIVPHTATAADSAWDTGSIASGDSASVVVRDSGLAPYRCIFHLSMRGRVSIR